MVERKSVILQMIPHTLFIEWDFGHYSRHCSPVVLMFTTLFTSCFTVHDTVHKTFYCSVDVGTVHDNVH